MLLIFLVHTIISSASSLCILSRMSCCEILLRKVLGISTFCVAMLLPPRMVDNLFIMYSNLTLGNTNSLGIPRLVQGPFDMKFKTGKTRVLDEGMMAKISQGKIKVN